jgi:RHH-type proline utilization regulon transcriptional repressor/proline dehydrogenase/delta 1-pyrroline-5-carboxylate dehydrogenase
MDAPTPPGPAETATSLVQILEVDRHYLADESALVARLVHRAGTSPARASAIQRLARGLVESVRGQASRVSGLQALLQHYDLSSEEGIALTCLAEALPRIPDAPTADKLITDKVGSAAWQQHLGASDSTFVNAATWGLTLAWHLIRTNEDSNESDELLKTILRRVEEPVLRRAMQAAMRMLARNFVMGETITEALARACREPNHRYRYSFDTLGEAALTAADAARYLKVYRDAIETVGQRNADSVGELRARPSVSVKLSALCPRFEYTQRQRAVSELTERLLDLAQLARGSDVALTVDAEEAERLGMTLEVFANVLGAVAPGWPGFGIAVQAYQKRALPVLHWLQRLAAGAKTTIPVRLVKGAYWDMEIKRAQELGLQDYPVFTRKCNTDVSYLACARTLLEECSGLYPQFATHNAHTIAYIRAHAGGREYEFQRLHGMGAEIYDAIVGPGNWDLPCRVYAPVGTHETLLPYLVRRLLENGANSSFVNRLMRKDVPVEEVIKDPVAVVESLQGHYRNPRIPLPRDLYAPRRRAAAGVNFADPHEREPLLEKVRGYADHRYVARPLIAGTPRDGAAVTVIDPSRPARVIGTVYFADEHTAAAAIDTAAAAFPAWNARPAKERAAVLERAADLLEAHHAELLYLCVHEAGKTLRDGHDEIREAVDFLRYYAAECREKFGEAARLPGPTGEDSRLRLTGRGVFLCISPWNFPVAIFTGQIAAALAAGNTVIAKPAEQTSLVAARIVGLIHEAGVPGEVLNFLPGDGERLGGACLTDPRIAGVAFTGSTATARIINRTLAARDGPIATLIAETGGINVMLVDSSALPEQVVRDIVQSAFNSAGQRCSALRILCLQEEIAPRVLALLGGFMQEWVTGDPARLDTDMGPIIEAAARDRLQAHVAKMQAGHSLIFQGQSPADGAGGYFVPPVIAAIENIPDVQEEVFGPVLHVLRYRADALPRLLEDINALGYGLTLGIQSRIEKQARYIQDRVRVGNVYVNRNMVGAVVGVHPFGGCGLSGTGPKAGGPHYLLRFATEQTYTVNTAAVGGNASLMTTE